MTTSKSYEECLELRALCGYDADKAIVFAVWDKCSSGAQEGMIQQFRDIVKESLTTVAAEALRVDRYVAQHGQVW